MPQGMSAEIGLHHTPESHVIGLVFGARNLVDNDLFFRLKITLDQARIHHIAEQLEGPLQVFTQDPRIVDCRLVGSTCVDFGADLIKLKGYLLPVQRFCALKDHVLQKVGDARNTGIRFITRTGTHIVRHGSRFKVRHRLTYNLQAIR